MKLKKSLSLLLAAVLTASCATIAATAASNDSEPVGAYNNQNYLETYAAKANTTNDFGATYSAASTTFKTWSPEASSVKVKLYRTGSDNEAGSGTLGEHAMTKDSTTGIWSLTLTGDYKNVYYTYLVTVNGTTNETQDIYSKATGVNGNRTMIVDLDATDPEGWSSDKHVLHDAASNAVVWEVHVRDFSISNTSGVSEENKGKYLAFAEGGTTLNGTAGAMSTGIDYLVENGVNTVQLQPVYDFGSVNETIASSSTNRNWGYDPVNYNVPEGSYSSNPYDGNTRITEFKQMIQALHDRGISVVMDVVYNHTYLSEGSCFNKTVPGYYYRMTSSTAFSNGSGCGNETASDKAMFRKYMIDSVKYWADEYHIDGFRFDLMALHDTTTIKNIRTALNGMYSDNSGQKILMYGEPWTGGTSLCPTPCSKSNVNTLGNVGAFNDTYRDAIKGSTDGSDGNFIQGSETATSTVALGVRGKNFTTSNTAHTVAYADAHDNLILWDKLSYSNGLTSYTTTNENVQKQVKGVMTLLLTSQGIPFMTAGSEMGRTKKGDKNSYKSSDDINGIDWSRANTMSTLPQWYKTLVQVRENFTPLHSSSFNTPTFTSSSGHVIGYTYSNSTSGEWSKVAVLYNNDSTAYTISNLGASSWTVVANSVAGSSISKTGADIKGIATLNASSVSVPAKGSIVLINNLSAKSVTDEFGTLTVRHVTESGTVLRTQNAKYRAGSTYRSLPDSTILFGRRLVNTTGATTGTVAKDGNYTVTYTYSDAEISNGYLTVKYVDQSGKTIKEQATSHLREGDAYNAAAPAIQGYELDTDKFPAGTVGTFDGNDKTITFTYKPLTITTTTVHYYNANNWATPVLLYAYDENGKELNGSWGNETGGGRMYADSTLGDKWVTGTVPAASAYVMFHRGNNQEPGQGETGYLVAGETWVQNKVAKYSTTIKVSHIDLASGQKIAADEVTTAEKVSINDTYTTSALAGRTDVIVPGNASGNYGPGVINVVYFYTGGDVPISTEPTTEPPVSTEPTTEDPNAVLIGDVTGDNEITIADATLIQKHLAELETLTGDALKAADSNGNGRVTIKDVTMVQKYVAEYTTEIGNVGKKK